MQETVMYVLFNPSSELTLNFSLQSESASTPTKLADLIDMILAYMPESIFQLVGRLPISGMKLVQKYKRVTDELARQLVGHQGDDNVDQSFVSHLCVCPIRPNWIVHLADTFQCARTSIPIPQLASHPARSQSTCVRSSSRAAIQP
jgi:hypothetical protein